MLTESQGRGITATMDTATVAVSAPGAASNAAILASGTKYITYYYKGSHLTALAGSANSVNLTIKVDALQGFGANGVIVNDISVNAVSFGVNTPIALRNGAAYRYGFNGKERDDEIAGSGNYYTTHFRQFDPRLGRWLSLDPVEHPHLSPYNGFDNNPIYWVDPAGSNATKYVDGKGEVLADIDDGSDEVFVVKAGNESALKKDLIEQNVTKDVQDASANAAIGAKHGFKLSELAENTFPESSFRGSGHRATLTRAGYHTAYQGRPRTGIAGAQQNGGQNFQFGYDLGANDLEAGLMNTFEPQIQSNSPTWNITGMIQSSHQARVQQQAKPVIYKVTSGDNLTRISENYGVPIKAIQQKIILRMLIILKSVKN